jgi:hypothetical protein
MSSSLDSDTDDRKMSKKRRLSEAEEDGWKECEKKTVDERTLAAVHATDVGIFWDYGTCGSKYVTLQ